MVEEVGKHEIKSIIKKFDGKDFILWNFRIEKALRANQCFEANAEDFDFEDDEAKKKEKLKIDEKIKFIIKSSLEEKVLRRVHRETASEIWSSLRKRYEEKDAHGVNFASRKFFNSKQEKQESVEDFLDRVEVLREELEAAECDISDEDMIINIIQGIKPAYETALIL